MLVAKCCAAVAVALFTFVLSLPVQAKGAPEINPRFKTSSATKPGNAQKDCPTRQVGNQLHASADCLVTVSATAATTGGSGLKPWEDYPTHLKARQNITALSADQVFGDTVDWYSGSLSFAAVDAELPGLPGLPVRIGRKLSIQDRSKVANLGRDLPFGDWDLDLPQLSGTFASNWHDARCSTAAPPTIVGPDGTSIFAREYWGGNHADMPGGGEMLRADVDRPKPQNGSYLWVTAGDTYFSCLSSLANGTGEGFLAVTKEGTKYWFNHMAQYQESQFSKPSTQTSTSCGD